MLRRVVLGLLVILVLTALTGVGTAVRARGGLRRRAPLLLAVLLLAGTGLAQAASDRCDGALAAGAVILVAPLVLVAVRRTAGTRVRWVAALSDAGAVALVAALPRWWPAGGHGTAGHPRPEAALGLLAVLTALLLLSVVTQTLAGSRTGGRERLLLTAGVAVLGLQAAAAAGASNHPMAPVWHALLPAVAAALWGLLLLRPAVERAADAADEAAAARAPMWRIVLLALLGGAAPASLLLGDEPITWVDIVPVVSSCVLLALCSLVHLSWRARQLSAALTARNDAVRRQRVLVTSGQGLLRAHDAAAVGRSASQGAVELLATTGAARGAAALAVGPPDLLELVAVHTLGLQAEEAVGPDLDLLDDADRLALRRGEVVVRPVRRPDTGEESTVPHDEPDLLLLVPLRTRGRDLGVLVVAGPAAAVHTTLPTFDAFAVQVSLALDASRTALTDDTPCAVQVPRQPSRTVHEIVDGLREEEFTCHYQPIVDMVDGTVSGFEALVRWEHPERGLLLPGVFLPVVDDAGLLTALDNALLLQACHAAVRLEAGPSGPYMSVNLSIGQLADPAFDDYVRQALTASGLAPSRLQLEVTEASSLRQPERAAATLARLRELGVRVAFDDFGTGHSSLSWLHQLPLDVVKVDKSFVDDLPTPRDRPPVVAAVTALSHVLGLRVVAEGVETLDQQHELIAMGVRQAQGWLYSKALPERKARTFLLARGTAGAPAPTAPGPSAHQPS